jgi:hypothetical protein
MLAPQDRQKLAPSKFWAAHFGQNILILLWKQKRLYRLNESMYQTNQVSGLFNL